MAYRAGAKGTEGLNGTRPVFLRCRSRWGSSLSLGYVAKATFGTPEVAKVAFATRHLCRIPG